MASGSPLSMDLRVRAVEAYENGEGTYQEIADRFCIGRTTLCDLVRLSRYAGTLEPNPIRGRKPYSVDEVGRERIRALVAEQPDAILAELNRMLPAGVVVERSGRVLAEEDVADVARQLDWEALLRSIDVDQILAEHGR